MPSPSFHRTRARRALCLSAALLGSACSPHTVRRDPASPVQLRSAYATRAPELPQADASAEAWWKAFGDAQLSALQDQALAGNFDLHAAWARLSQADAVAGIAGAPRWPQLGVNAGASRTHTANYFPAVGVFQRTYNGVRLSAAASYEVDVWDRIGAGARAAALDRDASADAVQALAISISAEVAEGYFNLLQAAQRRRVLQQQLEVNTRFIALLQLRFQNGQATIVDVNQQQQQVLAAKGQLAQQEAAEEVLLQRLAVLLGKVPGELSVSRVVDLPAVPPLPHAGVPSELLRRRPDVRAAQRRVQAADERVAVAVADRYPQVTLTGDVAVQPTQLNSWLMQPIWNLAAGLAMPIIDGGRRAAEAERTRAVLSERVADYGNAVLSAILEVESALAQERGQHALLAEVKQQAEVAQVTLEQARERYGQGQSDFLTVLTALRSQQQTELSLLDAQRQLLSYRIQLYRALGGDWTASLEKPEPLVPTDGGDAPREKTRGES